MSIVTDKYVDRCIATFKRLKAQRVNFEWLWQRVSDMTIPRRADFVVTRYPGQRRDYNIYDSTAPWALDQFAAGLHSLLTSQALPWFYLRLRDKAKMKNPAVQAWLQDTADRINAIFNDPAGGFQSQVHEYYLDIGAFGTAVMYVEDHNGIKFSTRFLGECFIRQTHLGSIDTLYRLFGLTLPEAIEMFGEENLPKEMREIEDPLRHVQFLHVVEPDGNSWHSCYICTEFDNAIVHEGHYDTFPYMVSRWEKAAYEDYGRSPAINCLSEIFTVNEMRRTILRAAQKAVDPPLLIPNDGFMQPINLNPNSPNYYDANLPGKIEFLESKGRFDIGETNMHDTQMAITRAFYVDAMQLPGGFMPGAKNQNTYMSATEASIRRENGMRVMGPMVSRMQTEFLGPVITRVYDILKKRRSLAPAPAGIKDMSIDIEYVSPLAVAQKAAEGDNFLRMIQLLNPLVQANPALLQKLNGDAVVEFAQRIYHVPVELLYTDAQMAQMRQAQAQAQQQQQQSNGQQPGGDIQPNQNVIALKRNMEAANSIGGLMQKMQA